MNQPSRDDVVSRLSYEPETGIFRWKSSNGNGGKAGDVAGFFDYKGYWMITFNGRSYRAHRLAWLVTYGKFPDHQIDHVNGVKHDNRIENLRDVPGGINGQNKRSARKDSKSGLLGASPAFGKWKSQIMVDGKVIYLGLYKTPEAAHQAYLEKKREIHPGCTI